MITSADFDRSFQFTGRELCRLMRTHKVTIRELAKRTQLPQRTIRKRRTIGATGHDAICYYEFITGSLTPRMKAALRQRVLN